MTQNIEEPTTNERGQEIHPAFARISAGRVSHGGGGAVLFDSDVRHQHTVRITISTATRERSLNRDTIFHGKELIEVELSEAQWAGFVSSMNGSGVSTTLRWIKGQGSLPGLPFAPRMAIQLGEVKDAATRLFAKAREAMDRYEQAITDKAGAREIKDRRRVLRSALTNSVPNMTFAATSLTEYAEDVVQMARADIEAMVIAQAAKLGLDPSQAQAALTSSLTQPAAIEAD